MQVPFESMELKDSMVKMAKSREKEKTERADKILEAAGKVLAEHGVTGATIARVAEEAGVSRGLVHYHYKNKEEMLAKVLRANMESMINLIGNHFEDCKGAEELAGRIVESMKTKAQNDSEYFKLFLEGLYAVRHSEIVRMELGELYGKFRDIFRKGLMKMVERRDIAPAIPPRELAALVTAMLDGIGVQLITVINAAPGADIWDSLKKGLVILIDGKINDQ